ncbi:alpha/beta hydrolase [Thermomicrobium sp. 4228-Ro]|uniref:alpha/beta hydrolase n=1 Tax=Thermomicrobium sp. 4228-Ro TaxID=2993937 RepID=UPI002248DA29|nr:alpha/beta hydrolase [Thermomicrobium sp. 4228-Ro]MCX2727891.1 alpha/beta hydrolase [Thermomicrobium sp. 4228-Ro]
MRVLTVVRAVGLRFLIVNRFPLAALDFALRLASAAVLSPSGRYRFLLAGIHPRVLSATLRRIRRLHDWPRAWVRTAHQYLLAAHERALAGEHRAAAELQRAAALCYHFGHVLVLDDLLRRRALYAVATRLYRAAAPQLDPPIRPVEVPWRDIVLPGYLVTPGSSPAPLVVFLNGASTSKEETVSWARPFLQRGIGVLALDTPGSGEVASHIPAAPGQEDIGWAILETAHQLPGVDGRKVALLGVSLRGAYAVQVAHAVPEFSAVVSVTAPFDPRLYVDALGDLVRHDVAFAAGVTPAELAQLAPALALTDIAPRLRTPLFVVGAGRDLVVPPQESIRLFRSAGGPKRLLFLRKANHVAFTHLEQWTSAVATWLAAVLTC